VLSTLFAGPAVCIGVLTAGLILSIMIIPFITASAAMCLETVPPVIKEAAYGIGCHHLEVSATSSFPTRG